MFLSPGVEVWELDALGVPVPLRTEASGQSSEERSLLALLGPIAAGAAAAAAAAGVAAAAVFAGLHFAFVVSLYCEGICARRVSMVTVFLPVYSRVCVSHFATPMLGYCELHLATLCSVMLLNS